MPIDERMEYRCCVIALERMNEFGWGDAEWSGTATLSIRIQIDYVFLFGQWQND